MTGDSQYQFYKASESSYIHIYVLLLELKFLFGMNHFVYACHKSTQTPHIRGDYVRDPKGTQWGLFCKV